MIWLALSPLALLNLWILFLAYASLKANWHSLSIEVKIIGAVVVFFGFILDVTVNWTLGLILGFTKDWTLSSKCGRIIRTGSGWRKSLALYICSVWLDPFEIGGHCRGN